MSFVGKLALFPAVSKCWKLIKIWEVTAASLVASFLLEHSVCVCVRKRWCRQKGWPILLQCCRLGLSKLSDKESLGCCRVYISTLWAIKKMAVHLWSYLWKVLINVCNFCTFISRKKFFTHVWKMSTSPKYHTYATLWKWNIAFHTLIMHWASPAASSMV